MDFINKVIKHFSDLPGWHIRNKIVVLESDDWGSIRMPSLEVYNRLESLGVDVAFGDNFIYNSKDSLATETDLSLLFEVLSSVKDATNRPAVMTAISVVANPDFKKIKHNQYQNYYFEPFTETLKRQKGCENSFDLWKEGISKNLFMPQFHAREHLNVMEWMRALQQGDNHALMAFDNQFWGYHNTPHSPTKVSFQAAFDYYYPSDLNDQAEILRSGLTLFEELFGYKARYFVPTNGPFSNSLEKVTAESGVQYIYGSKIQHEPIGNSKTRRRFHYLGQKNRAGQLYMMRNCIFEPSLGGKDWVDACLADIDSAFKCRKPAVISSHRVNFIGALDKNNRYEGLLQLSLLLKTIVKRWPEVVFMTSVELGDLMANRFE